MQLNSHLHFNGQCEAAFKFYEQHLGGKITFMMPYESSPVADHVPAAWRSKILHATLTVGDEVFTAADVPPEHYQKAEGLSMIIGLKDPAEGERIFHGLAENGTVQMPLQQTFWAARFGMLVDQFGIPWIINCGKASQEREIMRRVIVSNVASQTYAETPTNQVVGFGGSRALLPQSVTA